MSQSAQPFFVNKIWWLRHQKGKFSIIDDNDDDMTAANQSRPNEETDLFLRAIDDVNVQLPF